MTGEHTLADAEHDAEAARLRSLGATYREIADRQGCSIAGAHKRVKRALATVPIEAVQELRRIEDARLDDLWKIAWREATRDHLTVQSGKIVYDDAGIAVIDHGPKLHAVNTLLRIQERRSKLHGLDEPTRSRVEVVTEDAIDAEIRALEAEMVQTDRAAADD